VAVSAVVVRGALVVRALAWVVGPVVARTQI